MLGCRNLGSSLVVVGLSLFVDALSHTIIFPLSPYMVQIWEPNEAWQKIGLVSCYISCSAFLGNGLSYCFWKHVSRRCGKKLVILFGCFSVTIGLLSLGLCHSLVAAVAIRFLMGTCNGIMAAAREFIPQLCSAQQQSVLNVAWSVGLIVGPSLAGILILPVKESMTEMPEFLNHVGGNPFFAPCILGSIFAFVAFFACIIWLPSSSSNDEAVYQPVHLEDENHPRIASSKLDPIQCLTSSPVLPTVPRRFVDACNGNGLEAAERWRDTMGWKDNFHIDTILQHPNPNFRKIREHFQQGFCGRSHEGFPVYYEIPKKQCFEALNNNQITLSELLYHYVYQMEFVWKKLEPNESGKMVVVIDLDHLTLLDTRGRSIEIVCSLLDLLQRYYPERLHQMFILNSPFWFNWVWKSLLPHIQGNTMSKIGFYKGEQIKEKIAAMIQLENVPIKYGGQRTQPLHNSTEEVVFQTMIIPNTGDIQNTGKSVDITDQLVVVKNPKDTLSSSDVVKNPKDTLSSSDSEEEDFFDCNEYGLQDDTSLSETKGLIQDNNHSSSSTTSSSSSTLFSNTRVVTMTKLEITHHIGSRNVISQAQRKHRRLSSSDNDLVSSIQLVKEKTILKVLITFCIWTIVQCAFDELYPLWCFSRRSLGDHSFSPASTGGGLALMAVILLIFELYLFPNMLARTQALSIFRIGILVQIPFMLGLALIEKLHLSESPITWILVVTVLIVKQFCHNIAFSSVLILLDNSVGANRRPSVHRLATSLEFFCRCIGCVSWASIYSWSLEANLSFPFDSSFSFNLLALYLVLVWLLTFSFPISINSPRLYFLDHV